MNKFLILLSCALIFACTPKGTQKNAKSATDSSANTPSDHNITVAFYNVENIFDTKHDENKFDEDFTPNGKYKWTEEKYKIKLKNISKVLKGLDADIIGLGEVENKAVIQDLINQPELKAYNYQIVHSESKDMRGIDVALIFRTDAFQLIDYEAIVPTFPSDKNYTSRDVLLVEGKVVGGEHLFIFVNHWPSRRGGAEESEPRRVRLAQIVKNKSDLIFQKNKDACILLMGDFNDDPSSKSIKEIIGAHSSTKNLPDDGFYNPMYSLHNPESAGTLTYRGKWNLFDQVIISENLCLPNNALRYVSGSAQIFHPQWMRVGYGRSADAPRRAIFRGEFRPDGFSDHFPTMVKLVVE